MKQKQKNQVQTNSTQKKLTPANLLQKIYINKFQITILLILFLAAFLRFYNYPNRWGMGNDSTRDIAIAREALARHELPLIGSFSSAGPFVFGPIFYWILMLSYIIFPFLFTAPVIITATCSVLTVVILIYCGYLIGGKKLAIILGVLAATSPQLVIRAVVVGQHTYVAIATALLFLTFILYWQRKNLIYAFFMGISVGFALSLHYQSINLLIFFAAVLFIPKINLQKRILGLLLMGFGFLIPSLPLIIWDSQQQWANTRNILDYLFIAQHRLYVPNSWKLFLFKYIPSYWAFVMSSNTLITLFLMVFTFITAIISLIKRKLPAILVAFGIIFSVLLLVNRYYKGERSEGYLIYLSPFLLLFTAWSIHQLFDINLKKKLKIFPKVVGVAILIIILAGNIVEATKYEKALNSRRELEKTVNFLTKKYPDTKFLIYDYLNQSSNESQSLSLMLKQKDKTDPQGMPIGLVCADKICLKNYPKITKVGYNVIVDLRKVKDKDKKESKWVKVNQENMYDDLIGWSKKHQLKSTFSLWEYINDYLSLPRPI